MSVPAKQPEYRILSSIVHTLRSSNVNWGAHYTQ